MKVTSLKDVESYIYSTVILPLKNLNVDSLDSSSPIQDSQGHVLALGLTRETVSGDWNHNYQRDTARENAKWLVYLEGGHGNFVVADYDPMKRNVRVYEPPFRQLGLQILRNKLAAAFRDNTPFNTVRLVDDVREFDRHLSSEEVERL